MKKTFQTITPKSRKELRSWLADNCEQRESVWVIIFKVSSGKKNLSSGDVAEEALCFGWIDSVPGKIDSEKYKLLISPRKPKSAWSAINKERIKKLIKSGLMTSAGLAKVELAKKNGSWNQLNASDRLEIPKELLSGLDKNRRAKEFFDSLAPSSKRVILEWIYAAKTDVTKDKRISETIALAAKKIRANHYLDLKKIRK